MLELRPTCENCNCPLPPNSTEAMICSFECTFCHACAADVLQNVCPTCGGGFYPRPVRPANNWNDENYLGKYPAGTRVKHHPVDTARHGRLLKALKGIPPEQR